MSAAGSHRAIDFQAPLKLPKARTSGVLAIRWAIIFTFCAAIYLPPFGIRILADFSLSFSLIAVYVLLAVLLAKGVVRIERLSSLLFILFLFVGIFSLLANSGNYISMPSFLLLAAIYLPFIFTVSPGAQSKYFYDYSVRCYSDLALALAVCAIMQFGLQFVLHASWLFNFSDIIPTAISASGAWNRAIPVNGLFKANGIFELEPSGLSMLLGLAVVIEVGQLRRYWRLAVLGLAMALSFSGTGILIVVAGLLIPTNLRSARRALILVFSGMAFLLLFGSALGLDFFVNRLSEFSSPNTSGYARFVAPVDIIQYGFASSRWAAFIGSGPGTIQLAIARYYTTFTIHDPTWAKAIFEYGIIGFVLICGLVVQVLRRGAAPAELKLAVFYTWLASGGQLVSPEVGALILVLVGLWQHPVLPRAARRDARKLSLNADRLRQAHEQS